jgi:pimeloyl-ACP methyl ester carboxylesterase
MSYVTADDGTRLWTEAAGSGQAIVFVHEFAGDARSWEPQLRHFSRRYRCVAFCARGYPPSDVPETVDRYGQERARDDVRDVIRGLGLERPHVVGLSMGAFATLHLGLAYPGLARSLVLAGIGTGAMREIREHFQEESNAVAERILEEGMERIGPDMAAGPTRVQLKTKDPRGWDEFRRFLAEHASLGSAMTLKGVQAQRPSLYDLEERLRQMRLPSLVISGDEDEPCLDTSLWLKRVLPSAGLAMLPRTGHAINLEEPAAFNGLCEEFFRQVEAGRWPDRDKGASGNVLGLRGGPTLADRRG